MLFDSHAHYDDDAFNEDRDILLGSLPQKGVGFVLNAGSNLASSRESVRLAEKYDYFWAAAGIHPHDAKDAPVDFESKIEELFSFYKVVAIGEIGLDYHYNFSSPKIQKEVFARQLDFAGKIKKPIIVHDREAHQDVMELIKPARQNLSGGVFHCYSGSVEMLKDVLDMGFYISLGGAVTFKNARRVLDVISYVPLDRLMLETDAPYMTPEPFRGARNDSSKIVLVAARIAELRGISTAELEQITESNTKAFFGISN